MDIQLEKVAQQQKEALVQLLELYSFDFTRFVDADVSEDGRYHYPLDQLGYFKNSERLAYFIRVESKLAGFALIRNENGSYHLNEFFVLYKYRQKGIGKIAAYQLFDMHPGQWIINQSDSNYPAHEFWEKVILEYSHNNVETLHEGGRTIMSFSNITP